jgi:glycosyltransferase involved in cell wall biosynthesis
MKHAPVSVIIPCYNCADTVGRAVESVMNQSLRPAEMILIDDGSSDSTHQCLLALQKQYGSTRTRLQVIALSGNQGPGAARNAGWNESAQPYLAFLDADDAWHPEKIRLQYGWMKNHPDVDICAHRCLQLDYGLSAWGVPDDYDAYPLNPMGLLIRNRLLTRSVMLKRRLPFRFPEDKRYSEDYQLWLEMVLNGIPAWYLDVSLAASFKHAYGEAGLSRNLAAMEKGELDTYQRLRRKKLLPTSVVIGLFGFSLIKHLRRLIIHRIQKTR